MKTSSLAAVLYLLAPGILVSAQDTVNNLRSGAVVSNAERNLGGPNDNGPCNGICNALEKACDGGCDGPGGEYKNRRRLSCPYCRLLMIYIFYLNTPY